MADFKPNGTGLPTACGGSNAMLRQKALFDHPVLLAYTIDSATYIVVKVDKNHAPVLAIRYRHTKGAIINAYDKSNTNAKYKAILEAMLQECPVLPLKKGRPDARAAGVAHGLGGGHGPSKRRGLVGHALIFPNTETTQSQ